MWLDWLTQKSLSVRMSESQANCSFEIVFDDRDQVNSSKKPFSSKKITRDSDTSRKDIDEKMEEVNRRKSDILEVTSSPMESIYGVSSVYVLRDCVYLSYKCSFWFLSCCNS